MRFLILIGLLTLSKIGLCNEIHPVSISWIQADLQDDRVLMNIKVSAEDLIYFHELSPDDNYELSKESLLKAARAHVKVLQTGIAIQDENDVRSNSHLTKSNFKALTKSSYNVMDLVQLSLHYQFEFELSTGVDFITFMQQLDAVPSISFLNISKNGNELVRQRELRSNQPFTIKRDATSIGSTDQQDFMLSYYAISDTKISHEITLPIHILQSFTQIKSTTDLEVLTKFITENSSVEVDESTIQPTIEMITLLNDGQRIVESIVNIRIAYSLKDIPEKVTLKWEHFNWKMRWFESIINAFGEEKKHKFSRFRTEFEMVRETESLKKN